MPEDPIQSHNCTTHRIETEWSTEYLKDYQQEDPQLKSFIHLKATLKNKPELKTYQTRAQNVKRSPELSPHVTACDGSDGKETKRSKFDIKFYIHNDFVKAASAGHIVTL